MSRYCCLGAGLIDLRTCCQGEIGKMGLTEKERKSSTKELTDCALSMPTLVFYQIIYHTFISFNMYIVTPRD